ncbi:hypothetical protein GJ631_11785 [Natronomonas sp. CBA1123]|uniref:hypothetical protein n=1 Tax=Natronomonas sp. CBA1123 TaxID=2668070 RepID=UPI0012EA4243|nr:hypothetical protein [Natronomonas sp. CBA1123]MUV87226.1 hypothetical protein [Natronomonas sp. CBA1123]
MRRRQYLAGLSLASSALLAGCSGSDDTTATPDSESSDIRREAFREALTENGITVRELAVDDESHVNLEYEPAEPTEESVRNSIDAAARAFFDRVYGESGWAVERLDARVVIDGTLVATWQMESEWIEQYLEGRISREEMAARVENSVERHDQ